MMYRAADYRRMGRESMQSNFDTCVAVMLIEGVLVALAGAIIPGIGALIVAGPLLVGVAIVFLSVCRRQPTDVGAMFRGFEINFARSLLAYILITLFVFLWALIPIAGPFLALAKAIAYSQAYFLLVDHPEMDAMTALHASEQMMQGHKWSYFCMTLSFLGWLILSAFTAGILAIVYVNPYMQATRTEFYRTLTGEMNFYSNNSGYTQTPYGQPYNGGYTQP